MQIIPKPFLILAGISGTGKTRFVREQAKAIDPNLNNYCLVPVRPDWHEPSDLLGYTSRLSEKPQYVATTVLKFIIQAWHTIQQAGLIEQDIVKGKSEDISHIPPYWLCLDEMNLAPVEQYFADYLSVLETREWNVNNDIFSYKCDPLLKLDKPLLETLKEQCSKEIQENDELWGFFTQNGISLPFNLIVAGTVNMDETTHVFSRKVLDRALSFDFSEFYPNHFDEYFEPKTQPKLLTYPCYTNALTAKMILSDEQINKTIHFLTEVNKVLQNTPFKLAYRALNELLLSVMCFKPKDDIALQSVWDDFLMMKVLPRMEGDLDKLTVSEDKTILNELENVLREQLSATWENNIRIDLLRETISGRVITNLPCRSKHKLNYMISHLNNVGFTHFWQ